jgi:hypothetical protein
MRDYGTVFSGVLRESRFQRLYFNHGDPSAHLIQISKVTGEPQSSAILKGLKVVN